MAFCAVSKYAYIAYLILVNMLKKHYYICVLNIFEVNPMFDFVSTDSSLDTPARDSHPESSYSPSKVNEALAIAYGYNKTLPDRHHLLALIEHYGITQSVNTVESF